MAAWGYEFYLLLLTRESYFQHEKIKSPRDHVISSICTALTDI